MTSSANPELRSSLSGKGTVDFATGDVQVSEVEHDITFRSSGEGPLDAVPTTTTEDAVLIGNRLYQAFDPLELPPTRRYVVLSLPKLIASPPAISLALNAAIAASPLDGPNALASVSEVGPSQVDGVAATEYQVAYAALTLCPAHEPVQVLNPPPSDLWVDGAGRLVRVRSTLLVNDRQPKGMKLPAPFAGLPQGSATSVATVTFTNFGDPVRISAATDRGAAAGRSLVLPHAHCTTRLPPMIDDADVTLRVVGAGLGRTGTSSLKLALERLLGGRCHHMSEVLADPEREFALWAPVLRGEEVDWKEVFAGYVA